MYDLKTQKVASEPPVFPPSSVRRRADTSDDMSNELCQNILISAFCLCHPLAPVEDLPAAAAHDKEPRVSVPVPEEEERVSALAGGSPESGAV